jgi:putative transposase
MKNTIVWLVHLLAGLAVLLGTGGTRAVLAESILLKQQLLVLQRSRRRAPDLGAADRFLFGFCSQFLSLYGQKTQPRSDGGLSHKDF